MPGGGGTQYKRSYKGRAAIMGSKISLYELPLIKARIWYMNLMIFPKFEPKLFKLKKILEMLGDFAQSLALRPIGI